MATVSGLTIRENRNNDPRYQQEYHQLRKSVSCGICLDVYDDPVTLPCPSASHTFCRKCILIALEIKQLCPLCSQKVSKRQIRQVKENLCQNINLKTSLNLVSELLLSLEPVKVSKSSGLSFGVGSAKTSASFQSIKNSELPNSSESASSNRQLPTQVGIKEQDKNISFPEVQSEASVPVQESLPASIKHFLPGKLVSVQPRTWIGINKLGGVGWIEAFRELDPAEDFYKSVYLYKVRYVLDNRVDDDVPAPFVEEFKELSRGSRSKPIASSSNEKTIRSEVPSSSTLSKSLIKAPSTLSNVTNKSSTSRKLNDERKTEIFSKSFGGKENIASDSSLTTLAPLTSSAASTCGKKRAREVVLLLTGIEESKGPLLEKKIDQLGKQFPFVTLSHRFDSSVTHLIVSVDKAGVMQTRTLKYLQALSKGLWIVSTQWVHDCVKSKHIVDEEPYEVISNSKAVAPMVAKRARLVTERASERLYNGYSFFMLGNFPRPGPPRSDMEGLLQACGAKTFSRSEDFLCYFDSRKDSIDESKCLLIRSNLLERDSNEFALEELKRFRQVNSLWVMDSITNYEMQPIDLPQYQ